MRNLILAIVIMLFIAGAVVAQAPYSVTDLGRLNGGYNTSALAINNQGHVVGTAMDASGHYFAFLYVGGSLQSLGSLGGAFSKANAINSSDRIVGRSTTAANDTHAFLYAAGQVTPAMVDLHNVLGFGGNFSAAISINDAGQIVGVATVPSGNRHAFLLTGSTPVDLHSRVSFGGLNSTACSITNTGWIAGVSDDANGKSRAFLYNLSTSTLTNLGTLGGLESTAWAVNASGNVVGESSVSADGVTTYAFRTMQPNPIGSANSLSALGGTYSTALGINSIGQIVGAADDAESSAHAFLYTTATGMQDLETLIPANSGWFFSSATAINDFGYIVGNGVHNGRSAAFLLTPNAPTNLPPTANAGGPYIVNEGGTVTVSASGSDPESGPLSFAWDLDNNGSFETSGQSLTFSAAALDGHSSRTIYVRVTDGGGLSAIAQAVVNIQNVAPTVGAITASIAPIPVNTTLNPSASFSDSGTLDTHTAVWNWDDPVNPSSAGAVTEANGSGSVNGSHLFTAAGVYEVKLTVTDDDGDSSQSIFQYVVVYDPNGGFITGGGWIDSPAGSYWPDQTLTGRANFGFVSKYQKGANVPTGNTEFQFKAGNFNFQSTVYEWLVAAGAKAQYKGSGKVNGAGDYGFLLTASDGQINGGDGVDKFRIKIWDKANGMVIYDNKRGASSEIDSANPQALGGGSIVIHKDK